MDNAHLLRFIYAFQADSPHFLRSCFNRPYTLFTFYITTPSILYCQQIVCTACILYHQWKVLHRLCFISPKDSWHFLHQQIVCISYVLYITDYWVIPLTFDIANGWLKPILFYISNNCTRDIHTTCLYCINQNPLINNYTTRVYIIHFWIVKPIDITTR